MRALVKKYGWIVLLLFVCGGMLSVSYNFLQDLFMEKGMSAAKAIYEKQVAEADAKAAAERQKSLDLSIKAGRDRETQRLSVEAEIRRINNVMAVFKSKTAAELREKSATIAEILSEKEKDEIVIIEQKEVIDYFAGLTYGVLFMWKISEDSIADATREEISQLKIANSACKDWSAKLEAKLKPSLWKHVKDGAVIGAAFLLGRISK